MRLDRYLSNATDLSRKQIHLLIKAEAVTVNGDLADSPAQAVAATDRVVLNDSEIAAPTARYFMLYKPVGVVSATRDSGHPTVIDLVDEPRPADLQVAGRLDIDATGLVLITDDGQWNHRLTAPRSHCRKRYRVTLAETLAAGAAGQLERGLWLQQEKRRTAPAELTVLGPTEVILTITEGRYHQVKRMFAALGNRVVALHREAVGAITLDAALEPGDYRPLTAAEIARV